VETYIKIGKSVLRKLSDYAQKNTLDDEAEYFPFLKIIIEGIANSYDGSKKDKDHISRSLIDFARQLYIDTWLKYAIEDEDERDVEMEKEDAIERFNELYLSD
jgi:hypothetical protein